MQNYATDVTFRDFRKPLRLYQLPIPKQIDYKLPAIRFHVINRTPPLNLLESSVLHAGLSDFPTLMIPGPKTKRKTKLWDSVLFIVRAL